MNGRLYTSNKNGNSIFLPAAGNRSITYLFDTASGGFYWSSSLDTGYPRRAYYAFFNSDSVSSYDTDRSYGQSIRPVYGEFIQVSSITLDKKTLNLKVGSSQLITASMSP